MNSLPYHHPSILIDRIVQLDHMTRGRMMFGANPDHLTSDAFMLGIKPDNQLRHGDRKNRHQQEHGRLHQYGRDH